MGYLYICKHWHCERIHNSIMQNGMKIIEKAIIGKASQTECEDGIAVNDDFVAVIDGSTSKTSVRINDSCSNGKYCMEEVKRFILSMPKDISAREFCEGITADIATLYNNKSMSKERLKAHPEERMTASAVIYSAFHRQIWMIGDCQCIANGLLYDNPKPHESIVAAKRAAYLNEVLMHTSVEEMQRKDAGREHIMGDLIDSCKEQNITFSVIDGFPIPLNLTKLISVDTDCHDIVLASDGYPFLKPTLKESEEALKKQLDNDPLCINTFKATKGLMNGRKSFDDRSYVRFMV